MKNILLALSLLFQGMIMYAQSIEPAPNDKSVVYFVRANGMGALINFTYFDGKQVIGRFNGPKYMRYECDPGEHLFWARSENKVFVEANLEAGKIYVIDVIPAMGGFKSAVRLVPVDPDKYKMKRLQKLLAKRDPEEFDQEQIKSLQLKMNEVMIRGLEKYENLKTKEKSIPQLMTDMTVEIEELKYVKKG